MPESGKEEKDGCNRHAAGRETLPRQDQYKQRTHAEKTASEEENFFCLKRNRTRCFAFCGFVSHILAGAYGNPADCGNKHGSETHSPGTDDGTFHRAVYTERIWNRAEKQSDEFGKRSRHVLNSGITFWVNGNEVGNYSVNNSPS